MRTTKTISVSMPPTEWKAMAGTAKKENRTITNVLFSAVFKQAGVPAQVLEYVTVGLLRPAFTTPSWRNTLMYSPGQSFTPTPCAPARCSTYSLGLPSVFPLPNHSPFAPIRTTIASWSVRKQPKPITWSQAI